jgi:hypothetical protein
MGGFPVIARAEDFLCHDCGTDTLCWEYYMVWDETWDRVGVDARDGILCIECLERRLGRMLCAEDFTDAPINGLPYARDDSPRLAARRRARRWMQLELAS